MGHAESAITQFEWSIAVQVPNSLLPLIIWRHFAVGHWHLS